MKTYRHPATGDVRQVEDDNKQLMDGLEAQGYVLWDAAAIKAKTDAAEKAKKEAADKLAAAQKEMAERYPERAPFFTAEEKPAVARSPQPEPAKPSPSGGQPPTPPAVPKKN